MRSRIFALAVAALTAACAASAPKSAPPAPETRRAPAAAPAHHGDRARVDALARPFIAGKWAPALSIALVRPGGSEFFDYGARGPHHPGPPDPDTVFEIGSVTKTFTATILAEAVERHLVTLDEPVAELLPTTVKVPSRDGKKITLETLATHHSGLPRIPTNLPLSNFKDPYAHYTAVKLYAFLSSYKLPRDPGAKFEYSNVGMGLVGFALSRKLGKPYPALVHDWIAAPLRLTRTQAAVGGLGADVAVGHDATGRPTPPWHFACLAGAGAIRSTARDMARFVRANIAAPKGVLGPAMALAHKPRASTPFGRIGLAWIIGLHRMTHIVWHNGQTGGFHAFVAFDPDRKLGVVVLANQPTMMVDKLGTALVHMLRGEPYKLTVPPLVKLSPAALARYVGKYQLVPGHVFTVTRIDDQLMVELTGQPSFPVYPISKTEFIYHVVSAKLTFEVDDRGRVTGLVLHQGGLDRPAKRLP